MKKIVSIGHSFAYIIILMASNVVCAVEYNFTTIAHTSDIYDALSRPNVNNSGVVAFVSVLDSGESGVFSGDGGPVTSIADSTGPLYYEYGNQPKINDNGTVAFIAGLDSGGNGIFTGNGGPLTTIANITGPFKGFSLPSINTSGVVVFSALLDSGGAGVYTHDGVAITTVVTISDFPGSSIFSTPDINSSGAISFKVNSAQEGVYRVNGSLITPIAEQFVSFRNVSSINDSGTVVFYASGDANQGTGIFIGDGGPPTLMANTSGVFETFGSASINNNGDVAFHAFTFSEYLGGYGLGIYTGSDAILDKVVAPGDTLNGNVVEMVFIGTNSLNDAGQISFLAWLSDGTEGIYLATPILDSDDDGLPDNIEDSNNNGIVDAGETDPFNPDSDNDGALDGQEDTNANGVIDSGEADPLNPDSDGDGLTDGYEINVGSTDPTSPTPLCANPGDMNDDGTVNLGDLLLLQRLLLGY
ncbi:MAG: DUF7453 family protein [Nitrosomonadaceae bacterium]